MYGYAGAVDYIDVNSENLFLFNDTVIHPIVTVDNIEIMNSLSLYNKGIINGYVNVCFGCDVRIENSGTINAEINVPDSSKVIQVIHYNSEIAPINVVNDNNLFDVFEISVENANRISWEKLLGISKRANKITFQNSGLVLDENSAYFISDDSSPIIEFKDTNTLYVSDIMDFSNKPVLSNVYGNGSINIYSEKNNPLYKFSSYISNNTLFVDIVRDTDYFKILGNNKGKFLNFLRDNNLSVNLLECLDSAKTMEELNAIMESSVRLNPIKLMKSVRTFNMFQINEVGNAVEGFSINPILVSSYDFDLFGFSLGAAYDVMEKLRIGADGYIAKGKYSSELDEYNFALYGGNVHIAYINSLLLARIMAGTTIADFDIGPIFDGDKTINDPLGTSVYSVADVGINFNLTSDFMISPFVRVGFNAEEIADDTDGYLIAGTGADFSFDVNGYDITYKYGFTFSAYTDGQLNAAFRVGINSIADKAGGTLDAGIISNEFGDLSYKVKLGINFKF